MGFVGSGAQQSPLIFLQHRYTPAKYKRKLIQRSQWNDPMYATTPLFLLKTSVASFEVSRFSIHDWAVSRHYRIQVTLTKPARELKINEKVALHFERQVFHGVIHAIKTTGAGETACMSLQLKSVFSASLAVVQTRVYSQQSLKQLLKQLLTEAGLIEGLDFELRLTLNSEPLWFCQDQETGLAFFSRLVAQHALVFTFVQQQTQALCIISDSLKKLPQEEKRLLQLNSPAGLYQRDEVGDLSVQGRLCSQRVDIHDYDQQKAVCLSRQASSQHAFAQGIAAFNGYLSGETAEVIQAVRDEQALQLNLTSQFPITPGQWLELSNCPLSQKLYHVANVTIIAVQEALSGALPLPLQESLHHSRLQYHLSLTPHFSGYLNPQEHVKPLKQFKTAKVEHRQGPYADLSEEGGYHLRLQVDEDPQNSEGKIVNAKGQASPWVRNALYFAGNHYGLSYPFQDGTEVITSFENGHHQRPMIIAALANAQAKSVVTEENKEDNLVSSVSGSHLLFREGPEAKVLRLSTPQQKNHLTLQQGVDTALFQLESTEGEMKVHAFETINLMTKGLFKQLAGINQYHWVDGTASIQAEKGVLSFQAEQNFSLRSEKQSFMRAKDHCWQATDTSRLHAESTLRLKAGRSMSFYSEQGQQRWKATSGHIYLRASQSITIKAAGSTLRLTAEQIDLSTRGCVQLNAPIIHGMG